MAEKQSAFVITVTTAGTAVAGPASEPGTFAIQPADANTGTKVYLGNDGNNDISSTTGFTLEKSAITGVMIISVANLNQWYFDADTSGDKLIALRIADYQ